MFEIGSSLREARTRQGLTVEELEARTKVRGKYLRLLEEERFSELPTHTYIKGFLRAYANELGLDGQLYVDEYNSRYVTGDEDTPVRMRRAPEARARRRDRRERRVVVAALAAIVAVTALVIVAWKAGGPEQQRIEGLGSPPTAAAPVARSVTLEVRAVAGPSFMEVRAGSRAGRQLYAGTLERGQVQRFPKRRAVYLVVDSPGNVVVKLNGNRVRLPEGGEALVRPNGVHAP